MPVSSGAAGRLGAEDKTQGSYLKMYLETLPREKRMLMENTLEAECLSGAPAVSEGEQRETHTPQGSGEDAGEERILQTPSKKSSICSLL